MSEPSALRPPWTGKSASFWGKDDFLSFNLNYNQQLDFISSANSHNDLSGMLQLKITGF